MKHTICALLLLISQIGLAQYQPKAQYYLSNSLKGNSKLCIELEENRIELKECSTNKSICVLKENTSFMDANGDSVYGASGAYIFRYDCESYVYVIPKQQMQLDKREWKSFVFLSLMSLNERKIKSINQDDLSCWVANVSSNVIEKQIR